jgi:hypothetical protein
LNKHFTLEAKDEQAKGQDEQKPKLEAKNSTFAPFCPFFSFDQDHKNSKNCN